MSLFCDKYRPSSLLAVDYHQQQAAQLKNLISAGDFPNLFIFGPSGAGKRTRIDLLLKEIYGSGAEKVHIQNETFETPSKRKIEIKTINSNYHIEVNPSEVGIYDKVVIQALIKNTASTASIHNFSTSFKTVVISNADRLTKDAQHALRRTMEENLASCRLILCAESSSRIIAPIKSRCLLIRVAAPKQEDIVKILKTVGAKEKCDFLTEEIANKIALESGRNLRRALLMLETMNSDFIVNGKCRGAQPAWLTFIKRCAKQITESQSVQQLMQLRAAFYELEAHLIPPELVFRTMVTELLKYGDIRTKNSLLELAACYEHKMRIGSKRIFHFEAFVAKYMVIFKRNLLPSVKMNLDDDDFEDELMNA
uniref:Replication factor C subunit 3 n=1 Tax=Aceria tosichella TaxID=561515 RepID=A0A6G1SLT9_9ACAR